MPIAHASSSDTAAIAVSRLPGWASSGSPVEVMSAADQRAPSHRSIRASLQHSLASAPVTQAKSLEGLDPKDAARLKAQYELQNYSEMVQMISNVIKMRGETQKSIIGNIR